ncbi:MAG: SAM-dependent methyltransferase [Ferrovum sp. 37-45-19]|jgi:SAM-dependent methyltransferase|uniref:class I SAM-dependent methyltransferase n=1 Tax=Ferrovum sp. JA12 TaxID=1356299 RepID=UPI0007038A86|nr:class I SAM-dependent methyltransferase [Ferrovum sp. JA12]OYV78849.1 MAG: SAM-dependent methyltransferase [Ferrovum sp. 21-44-67]OYV93500.1 MAG: SAM-dependent methyltransferase [Ferrovum sp. 37-45-19]OZB33109.1 MAG: SAM-dependent methyltransferase [Ferrovum sp. 34-44-207]HQT82201.1 methyltransferase domain-containing protein [Ferrovaceae bacterium]KRH79934.1 ubiquinone biosynthesis O-methyltransferase [Ferrovum sp. JA12]
MSINPQQKIWTERYKATGDDYLFGEKPNTYLARQSHLFHAGQRVLCVADGEGRNSVWLAKQGLSVTAVEISEVAVEKAKRLATKHEVVVDFQCADLLSDEWLDQHSAIQYDWVIGIFIQFADPKTREKLFFVMKHLTQLGGGLILQGYTPKQLEYKTGGPSVLENLYTEDLMRSLLKDWRIEELTEYQEVVSEGHGHHGLSALMGVIAYKTC